MPKLNSQPEPLPNLRQRALKRLTAGGRDDTTRATPSQALAVLHDLASSADTAADALAVLHELQVHQVELELQHEELRASSADLEAALTRQTMLYENAPVAYLTLDAGAVVCELNLAGARLLGAARDDLLGQGLRSHLSPGDSDKLLTLMSRTRGGQVEPPCDLVLTVHAGAPRKLLALASADATPGRCLVMLVDLGAPP